MNSSAVKETRDVLVAIASIVHDFSQAHADGKISKLEAMHIGFGNVAEVISAFSGITEIGKELADITPVELDDLYHAFMDAMELPERTTSRDVFNILYNWLWHTLTQWQALQATLHPPKAEVVPEVEGVDPP